MYYGIQCTSTYILIYIYIYIIFFSFGTFLSMNVRCCDDKYIGKVGVRPNYYWSALRTLALEARGNKSEICCIAAATFNWGGSGKCTITECDTGNRILCFYSFLKFVINVHCLNRAAVTIKPFLLLRFTSWSHKFFSSPTLLEVLNNTVNKFQFFFVYVMNMLLTF